MRITALVCCWILWCVVASSGSAARLRDGPIPEDNCGAPAASPALADRVVDGGVHHAGLGPSATGVPWIDVFTGGGAYMPRTHCLLTPEGKTDWPWVTILLVLSGGVIVAYLRIFIFWMKSYFGEKPEDRNHKLFDLAAIFLFCAICGYAMSMVMFAWPGYRLLAVFLMALNVFSWRFCRNLRPFQPAFASGRLERELREALESRARELQCQVAVRTAEVHRLAEIARRTANAVLITDAQGRVEWANEGFTRITGYTLEEVLGKKPGAVLQGPETDPAEARRIGAALRRGESVTAELVNYTKDGRPYFIRFEIEPLHDESGNLTGFMSIETDVTEQRRAEEGLLQRERQLKAILAATPGAIYRCSHDREWTMQFISDGIVGLVGYPASDFIENSRRTFASIIHPEDARFVEVEISDAVQKDVIWQITYRVRHSDGSVRWVFERGRSVSRPDGENELVGFLVDVTAQKTAEAALEAARDEAEAATRAKSEFLANMSHEIRTPMTAILGYTDLLAEDGDRMLAPKSRLEYIETIKRNGEHLLALINDILDLSKIEAGKMSLEQIPMSPGQLLLDIQALMRIKAAGKGIGLDLVSANGIPEVIRSDPFRLKQILVNLVGNAIKFTEIGGVTVRVELDALALGGPVLRIDVEDTGIGMTVDQTSRLFGAFAQADASTTRRFGGTGLGLRISRRLAEMMGGEISVMSAQGEGSIFSLTIPTGPLEGVALVRIRPSEQPIAEQAEAQPNEPVSRPLKGLRIFLAEDGPDNQRLISHHLRKAGAEVHVFDNGLQALEAIELHQRENRGGQEQPCDLIVTDMQMPLIDGYMLARTLRTSGWTGPIIALTAHAMAGDEERCLAAGCDGYTTKPVERDKLIALCERFGRAMRQAA